MSEPEQGQWAGEWRCIFSDEMHDDYEYRFTSAVLDWQLDWSGSRLEWETFEKQWNKLGDLQAALTAAEKQASLADDLVREAGRMRAAANERAEALEAELEGRGIEEARYLDEAELAMLRPRAALVRYELRNMVLQAAFEHVAELRQAWHSGALSEHDGKGGMRSNRNADVYKALKAALEPAAPSQAALTEPHTQSP